MNKQHARSRITRKRPTRWLAAAALVVLTGATTAAAGSDPIASAVASINSLLASWSAVELNFASTTHGDELTIGVRPHGALTQIVAITADPPDPDADPPDPDADPPTEADPPQPDKPIAGDPPTEVDPPDPDLAVHVGPAGDILVVVDAAAVGAFSIVDSNGRPLELVPAVKR